MSTESPTIQTDAETTRRLDEIRRWASQPGSRVIPENIRRAAKNPAAYIFIFIALLMLAQVLLFTTLFFSGSLHTRGGDIATPTSPIVACLIIGPEVIIGVIVAVWGIRSHRRYRRLLSQGQLTRGRVVRISSRIGRINGHTFSSIHVEFTNSQGQRVVGKDTVDDLIVERFIQLRDSQQDIDVLALPNCSRVICLLRLATAMKCD